MELRLIAEQTRMKEQRSHESLRLICEIMALAALLLPATVFSDQLSADCTPPPVRPFTP
jgi:hypothetical protein